ncbi:hypothetical protein EFD56_14325 [Rhizobium phaseoli]|uniref:hypothetical protein n=1 Tax=Rhizobium phaseoli TaxID=396 RepID=UPI000F87A906|nr:hypothetical protein [Rhizobium phaseoli]RUM18635.1 hypothetical protein EFD56_14325 [Rhizobium phaseoli]
MTIHGWIGTDDVDQEGYRILDKHAVVTFAFEDILDLQLDGFKGPLRQLVRRQQAAQNGTSR